MRPRRLRGWTLVSWLTLMLGATAAGLALTRAIRLDPLPAGEPASPDTAPTATALAAATPAPPLENDPFRPDRRLPDARVASSPKDTVPPVDVAAVRLVGTVVRPAGSFAVCQLSNDAPRLVHVGERLGDLTLVVLEQGRVVFQTRRGARFELSLSKPRS